jgi:SAM-dependent methyltransferase
MVHGPSPRRLRGALRDSRIDRTMTARICPACGRPDPLGKGQLLWPPEWACPACGHTLPVRDGIGLTAPTLADTVADFDPDAFDFIARAQVDHFWFVARRRLLLGLVDKYAAEAGSFLDIGCGSGDIVGSLARARTWSRIAGTDIHPRGLSLARARLPSSVELFQADARAMPLRETFELAGAFDVLEHVVEDVAVIAGVRSSLVDGGIFLCAVPQHPGLWSVADEVGHHVRRYARQELDRKLEAGGFKLLFSTSYAVGLLPLMAVSRVLARRRRARVGDPRSIARREFDLAPGGNRLLTALLDAETALTRRGVRWPAGGSRVVVARKA